MLSPRAGGPVIEHGTSRIWVLGAAGHPVQCWVVQQARNLLMELEDAEMSVKFVPRDRGVGFTAASGAVFRAAGARVIRPTVQAPPYEYQTSLRLIEVNGRIEAFIA